MLQRLVETFGAAITRQLDVQYRMHAAIMRFSSGQFYGDSLQAHETVCSHLLSDLPNVSSSPLTDEPMEYIDTAGASYDEEEEPDGSSRRNPAEGRLVLAKVRQLLEAGLPASDIAVIAPYAAQVRWLREHAPESGIEIDTVDGFQGREKEAVVISLVRSNREGEIGFLQDTRRMNVALTRGPSQVDRRGGQRDARRASVLRGTAGILRSHEQLPHRVGRIMGRIELSGRTARRRRGPKPNLSVAADRLVKVCSFCHGTDLRPSTLHWISRSAAPGRCFLPDRGGAAHWVARAQWRGQDDAASHSLWRCPARLG